MTRARATCLEPQPRNLGLSALGRRSSKGGPWDLEHLVPCEWDLDLQIQEGPLAAQPPLGHPKKLWALWTGRALISQWVTPSPMVPLPPAASFLEAPT